MTEGRAMRRQTRDTKTRSWGRSPRQWLICTLCVLCVLSGLIPEQILAQDTVVAGVRIGLTYDRSSKPGVSITAVGGTLGDSVFRMLRRDFDFSDRMTPIAPDSTEPPSGVMNYPLYAQAGAIAIVHATVTPANALHVAVHDVAGKRVMLVMDLALPSAALSPEWRAIVHLAADSAEWAILGQRGIAGTRVAYMRGNQLWTVDSDGAAARTIAGTSGAMSPAWHPSGTRIAYNLLPDDGVSRVVVRDLRGGAIWSTRVGSLNMSPVFSPDGVKLVFAAGSEGTDLYSVVPFTTDPAIRLTSRRGSSNSSPTFSPDGRQIAFTSGLLGHPELYIMDADGSGADVLTNSGFGDQLYRSNPDWSPDGRRVAFQSMINGSFQAMTIAVRDRSTQQLTSDGANEDPSWAPDGRHIAFVSTRTGTKELWVLDTESSRTRQLTHGGRVQNPAWSPHLEVSRQP